MDKELIYKKIDNCFEIRKYLSTYVLVISGGIVSLLFGEFNIVKMVLFVLGSILEGILILGLSQ